MYCSTLALKRLSTSTGMPFENEITSLSSVLRYQQGMSFSRATSTAKMLIVLGALVMLTNHSASSWLLNTCIQDSFTSFSLFGLIVGSIFIWHPNSICAK